MTSVKVKFRDSAVEGKIGTIYYQIIQKKMVRQINTSLKIFANEWDENSSKIVSISPNSFRISALQTIDKQVKLDLERLSHIISSQKNVDGFTAEDIVLAFKNNFNEETLFNFMSNLIVRLVELRRFRTAETYRTTLNSFMRFRKGNDLLLVDISSDLMMDYQTYLKCENITLNTISFYMRILRAVYNRAVENMLIEQNFPFKKVYTGVEKTSKRALRIDHIKRIKELDFSQNPECIFARDMFLFSFYTRGMSFVDIAYLKKSDLNGGILTYRRRKTGQKLHIKWEKSMQEIIDRYPNTNTKFLLPIIKDRNRDERAQYINNLNKINVMLKKIGEILNMPMPLTLYAARHSWASAAKNRNIPISVISQAMGHNSETTTQIYLDSLDNSIVDNANNLILKLL